MGDFRLTEPEPGEDRDTRSLEAARHWVQFYRELVGLERKVLDRMEQLAASQSEDIRSAVMRSNIEPMRELISEFEARSSVWEGKLRELER